MKKYVDNFMHPDSIKLWFPDILNWLDMIKYVTSTLRFRMKCAQDQGVPITNYGIAIAHMRGILKRSTQMLPQVRKILEKQ